MAYAITIEKIKIMTKECKKARNSVLIPLVLLVSLLIFLSSCAESYTTCPAYASVECENCDEID